MAKQFVPVVRVAPLGELRVYVVTEAELDELARGSPVATHLNLAIFFWGAAIALLSSLLTTSMSTRVLVFFVVFFAATSIAGFVLTALWHRQRRSSKDLVRSIRSRMPLPEGIQEPSGGGTSFAADAPSLPPPEAGR